MSTEHTNNDTATEGCAPAAGYADRAAGSVARTMMVLRVLRRRCHRKGEYQQARVFERLIGTLYAAEYSLAKMQKHTARSSAPNNPRL